jgi:glucokinase
VADAAQQGDAVGLQAYREAGEWLGVAAASVVNLVNPGLIVVGGGVAQTGGLILAPMREMMAKHTLERAREGVEIVPAMLGTDAGILGAAMAAFDLPGGTPL